MNCKVAAPAVTVGMLFVNFSSQFRVRGKNGPRLLLTTVRVPILPVVVAAPDTQTMMYNLTAAPNRIVFDRHTPKLISTWLVL